MSYILDALRKSAEDRRKLQEQKPQSLHPLATPQESKGRKGRSRRGILFVCILLLGALAGTWFYYSQIKPDISAPETSVQLQKQEPPSAIAEQGPAQTQAPATAADKAVVISANPALESPQALSPLEESPEPPTPLPAPEETARLTSSAAIPLLQELPFATQAAIPEMKFSGHVFSSDPALRLVMVNTAIVREGDMITPDIKLIEITENGLVFSYRQTPFKVELF